MSHGTGVWCVGALVVASGCAPGSFLGSGGGSGGPRCVVAGPVGVVSADLREVLGDLGVAVLEKREDDEVILVGTTGLGKLFSLRLRPEKAKSGAQSAVTSNWEREADESFWRTVVQRLTEARPAASRTGPGAVGSTPDYTS
jgi:hypothetical protein